MLTIHVIRKPSSRSHGFVFISNSLDKLGLYDALVVDVCRAETPIKPWAEFGLEAVPNIASKGQQPT